MKRREQIRMTEQEIAQLLTQGRSLAVATISPDGAPHLVAMWYALTDDGKIALWMYAKSQKALNLHYGSTDLGAMATYAEAYNGYGYRNHGGTAFDGNAFTGTVLFGGVF